MTIGYTQQFDDEKTPKDIGFEEVRSKLNEWIEAEAKRVGPTSPEPKERVLLRPGRRPRDPMLDLSNEPPDRRFRRR